MGTLPTGEKVTGLDLYAIKNLRGNVEVGGLVAIIRPLREAGDIEAGDALLDAVCRSVAAARETLHRLCQHDAAGHPREMCEPGSTCEVCYPEAPAAPAPAPLNVTVCCPECSYTTTVPATDPAPVGGLWCQSCGEFLRARVA